MAEATTSTTPPEDASAKTKYRQFVQNYMKTQFPPKKEGEKLEPETRERMSMAAAAWRKLHPEIVPRVRKPKVKATSPPPAKKADHPPSGGEDGEADVTKVVLPKGRVSSLKDLSGFLATEGEPKRHRQIKLALRCTKKNSRALRQSCKAFKQGVVGGKVLSLEEAFLAGANALIGVAQS
jgi:hypothetical protein